MTTHAAIMGATSSASQAAGVRVLLQYSQHRRSLHGAIVVRDAFVAAWEEDVSRGPCTSSDVGCNRLASWVSHADSGSRRRRFSAGEFLGSDKPDSPRQRRGSCGASVPSGFNVSPAGNSSMSFTKSSSEGLLFRRTSLKKVRCNPKGFLPPPVHATSSMSNSFGRQLDQDALASTKCAALATDRDLLTAGSDSDLLRVPNNAASLPLRLAYQSSFEPATGRVSERMLDTEKAVVLVKDRQGDQLMEGVEESTSERGSCESRDVPDAALVKLDKEIVESSWWEKAKGLPVFQMSPRTRGLLLFNLLSLLWGSNISVVKGTADVLDPAAFCALRFSIAALAFSPWLWNAVTTKKIRQAGIELGLWGGGAYLALAIGLVTTDAGRASFINIFSVIVVPILAGLFGAKIPKVTWFSAAAAIAGVGLLEASGPGSLSGDLWTFGSALLFGVLMLRQEHYSHSLSNDKNLGKTGSLSVIGLQLVVYALIASIWATVSHLSAGESGLLGEIVAGDWSGLEHTLAGFPWFATVYTGLFSTALCLWIELTAMCDISATEAAMVYTLEPVWGAAFAWVLLGERWGPQGWLGAALIIGGSAAMQLFGKAPEETLLEAVPAAALPLPHEPTTSDRMSSQASSVRLTSNQVAMPSTSTNGATLDTTEKSGSETGKGSATTGTLGNGSATTGSHRHAGATVKLSGNVRHRKRKESDTAASRKRN